MKIRSLFQCAKQQNSGLSGSQRQGPSQFDSVLTIGIHLARFILLSKLILEHYSFSCMVVTGKTFVEGPPSVTDDPVSSLS